MPEVDKLIDDMVLLGGMYMRYSDDFIIVLPDVAELNASEVFEKIHVLLEFAPRLTLKQSKTQYVHYSDGILENCGKRFYDEADGNSRFINFLGFTFDGPKVSIRAKTSSKYYYRMYRKAKNIANAGGYTSTGKHISCENLCRRYSERSADEKPGNFLTYVSWAERDYGSNEAITCDTKRHMQKIGKALNGERPDKQRDIP